MKDKLKTRVYPIYIKINNKSFYIEYKNNKLVAGGDLPRSKAVEMFCKGLSKEIIIKMMEIGDEDKVNLGV